MRLLKRSFRALKKKFRSRRDGLKTLWKDSLRARFFRTIELLEERTLPAASPFSVEPAFASRVAVLGDAHAAIDPLPAPSTLFSPTASAPNQVVFIDSSIANYRDLVAAAGNDAIVLESHSDGVRQITDVLRNRTGLDSIQIVSHGAFGQLLLGNTILDSDALNRDGDQLAVWGQALKADGDILLYGCEAAQGPGGVQFVSSIALATGADVAASTNPTGSAALGGDWNLEYRTGPIEAATLAPAAYGGLLGIDLPTYIQDLLGSYSASFDVTEPLIGSADLGGFLNLNNLTLTAHATLGAGGWSGTVELSATSATLFPGSSFSAALTGDAPGQAAITGTFTIGAGFELTVANLTLNLGEALTITATDTNLTYNPSGSGVQTLVTIQNATVSSEQFAGMPTATLDNFALRTDGFSFDTFTLASAAGSSPGIDGFLTTTGVTLTASAFDVTFGTTPTMSGTVGIAITGLTLFPEGDFIQFQSTGVTASYSFANFNGTDSTGHLSVTISGFQLNLGEALVLRADADVTITPGDQVLATVASATLSSPRFASLGTVAVTNLEITRSGFSLGNLSWASTGAVSIGGDIFTLASVAVTVSNFALDYLKPATESVTWASSTNIVLGHVPTNLPDVVITSTPSSGITSELTPGSDYTLVPGTGGVVRVMFTGHTPAVGDAIVVSYGYAAVAGSISFAATGVKLFPNIPVLNVSLGSLSGSFNFGDLDAPGRMNIHIGDLNIPLGDALTIGLGSVDITPGLPTMLSATGVTIKTSLFSGFPDITLPTLDITQTGFNLGTFSIATTSEISIGSFATFSNASILVTGFAIDKTASPIIGGTITATLGSMTLFPGNPVVTSTITGVTSTFDFADIANPGRFSIDIATFSLTLFNQITFSASNITITPALDTIATIGQASIAFAALNGLSLDVANLGIQRNGFSIGSATVTGLPNLTLGSILTLTSPNVSLTNFEYARVQQSASEPTTWGAGTTISLQHKPASLATVEVKSKIGSAAATTLVKGTDYNLVNVGGVTRIQFTGHTPAIGEVITANYSYFGADTLTGIVGLSAGASSLNLGGAFIVSIASATADYDLATKVLNATLDGFSLNVAGFANLTIVSAALSYIPATDGTAKMLLGASGVTGFFGVPGTTPIGVTLSDGKLAVAVFKPAVGATTYALEASGEVALTGLPANTLTFTSGQTTFRKSTAGAVHEVVSYDGTVANSLHLDFAGNETSAMGRGLSLSVGSFISLSADFAFKTFVDSGATYIVVAANHVLATVAAGSVSLTVEDASLGIVLKQAGTSTPAGYALVVNGGKDSLNGIPGFTLESNGLTVRVRKGLDVSSLTSIPASIATPPLTDTTSESFTWSGATIALAHAPSNFPGVVVSVTRSGTATTLVQGTDYSLVDAGGNVSVDFTGYTPATGDAIAVAYAYQTPQSVALDFAKLGTGSGDVTDVQGHVKIAVAGFASLEGDFGFQVFTATDKTVTLAIGATNVEAVLGTDTANVTVSGGKLGFLSQNGKYALLAGADAIDLNGVTGLTLSSNNLSIRIRKGLNPATISGLPVIQTPGGDITLNFAGLGNSDVTDVEGHVTLAIDGMGSLEGDFGFQSYQDGTTGAKQIAIGATNLTAIVGTSDVNLTVANASFGLVLRPGVGLAPATYALIARGSSTPADTSLNGVPGIDLTASNLLVRVRKGLDLSQSSGFPSFIHTSGGDVVPDFSGLGSGSIDVVDVQGAVSLTVADFVTLQGEFGFQRYTVGTGKTADNYFAIGVHGSVTAGTGTETLSIDDTSVGVLIKKPAVGAVQFALQAKGSSDPANTTFVGPTGLTLSASNLVVRVKRGLDLSTYPAGVPTSILLPAAAQSTVDPDAVFGIPQIALANTNVNASTIVVTATPDGGTATTLALGVDYSLSTNSTTKVTKVTFLAGHFPAAGTAISIAYRVTGGASTITDPDTIVPEAGSILLVQTGVDRSTVVVTSALAGSTTFSPVASSNYTLQVDASGRMTLTFNAGSVPVQGTTIRIGYTYRSQAITLNSSETLDSNWATQPNVSLEFLPANPDAIEVRSKVGGITAVRVEGTDYTVGQNASGRTTITFLAGHLPDAGTSVRAAYGYQLPQPLTLDFGDLGSGTADITDIQGHVKLALDGFASLEGDFGFQIYKPAGVGAVPTFVVGGTNINAVLGTDDTNLTIADAEFGLFIRNKQMALVAHGGTVALNGIPDLTLQATDLRVKVRSGLDPSTVIGAPTSVHTPGGDVTFDFKGLPSGDATAIQGHATVNVANFVALEGDFSFTMATTGVAPNKITKILIGASDVDAFIGAADRSVGVQLTNASLAMVMIKNPAVVGSKYAIQVSSGVEVVGLPTDVTLTGTAMVAINTTGSTAVNSETIPNAPAFNFTSGNIQSFGGHLTFAVGSDFSLDGDFSVTKSLSGNISKVLIGAANLSNTAGSTVAPDGGGTDTFTLSGGKLGVVLYRDIAANKSLGYALSASATATLSTATVSAGATLNIRRNTTTMAHNDTVIVGPTSIPVVFSAAEVQTGTAPVVPFQSISLSDVSLSIDNTLIIQAGSVAPTTPTPNASSTVLTGVTLKLQDPGTMPATVLFTIGADSAVYTTFSGPVTANNALGAGLPARGTITLHEGANNGDYTLTATAVNFNSNKIPALNTKLRVSYSTLAQPGVVHYDSVKTAGSNTTSIPLDLPGVDLSTVLVTSTPAAAENWVLGDKDLSLLNVTFALGSYLSFSARSADLQHFTLAGGAVANRFIFTGASIAFLNDGTPMASITGNAIFTYTTGLPLNMDGTNPNGFKMVSFGITDYSFLGQTAEIAAGTSPPPPASPPGSPPPPPPPPPPPGVPPAPTTARRLGPLTLDMPTIGLAGFAFDPSGKLGAVVAIGAGKATIQAGASASATFTTLTGTFEIGAQFNLSSLTSPPTNPYAEFRTITAARLDVQLGTYLTLSATTVTVRPEAGADQDLISFGSIAAHLVVGAVDIVGSASKFAIQGDGSFVAKDGFGVSVTISDATKLGIPSFVPLSSLSVSLQWPHFNTNPERFLIQLSAAVGDIGGLGLTINGSITNVVIDPQLIFEDKFPIISIDSAAVDVSGNLIGGQVSGTLIFGVVRFDSNGAVVDGLGNLVGKTTPGVAPFTSAFYTGIAASISIGGTLSFAARIGISEFGLLQIYVEAGVPIPLGPTGLFLSDFRGGITFGATFPTLNISDPPSANDALQLRQPAFNTPDKLTAAQWETQLRAQVARQYKANPGGGFQAPTGPFIIQAGATVYAANKNAFRIEGDLFIDTSGKILILGTGTFGNNLTVGVKLYTDLSKVFNHTSNSASVLFLMETPAQPNNLSLPPTYSIFGVLTITDLPGAFKISIAGAMEYQVLSALKARVEATITLTFTSNSFNITLSSGQFFIYAIQAAPLGQAAGSLTIQTDNSGNVNLWGGFLLVPNVAFLEPFGIHVGGQFFVKLNTTSEAKQLTLSLGSGNSAVLDLAPQSFSLLLVGHADFEISGAQVFRLDGTLAIEITNDHLSIFVATTLLLGSDPASPIMTFNANGLVYVQLVQIGSVQPGFAIKLTLSTGVNIPGVRFDTTWLLAANTTMGDVVVTIPTPIPTTPPSPPIATVLGPDYLSSNPLALTSYEVVTNNVRTLVVPRGAPANGLANYKTWSASSSNAYFIVLGRGNLTIANTIVMSGNMNILGTISSGSFSFTMQMDATMAVKLNGNTVFSYSVAGAIRIGNDGIAAALAVNYSRGFTLPSSLGIGFNAQYVLQLNTTNLPQTFFVPNFGQFDIPATQFVLIHGSGHLTFLGNVVDLYGKFNIAVTSTSLTIAIDSRVTFLGATFEADGSAGIYYDSNPGLALRIGLSLPGGAQGIAPIGLLGNNFVISGAFKLELNTSSATRVDSNGVSIAPGFRVAVDNLGVYLYGFNLTGSISIGISNAGFDFDVNLNLDLFGFASISVSGYYHHDGSFSFTGSAGFQFGDHTFGIGGTVSITVANNLFRFSVSGWAAAFGIEISAGGSIQISGTSVDITVIFQVTIVPAINIDTPDVDMGLFTIPGIHIHSDAVILAKDATFHLGSISPAPIVAQIIPPAPPPTPPHLAGFLSASGPNTLVLYVGQDNQYRVNDDLPPVLTPSLTSENYTLTRVAGDPNSTVGQTILVSALNFQQVYNNVTSILVNDTLGGNDTITIDSGISVPSSITLGSGNNTINTGSGPATVFVTGVGNNNIVTGNGSTITVRSGATGNNSITSGNGSTISISASGNGTNQISAGAGATVTLGGTENNTAILASGTSAASSVNITGTGKNTVNVTGGSPTITIGGAATNNNTVLINTTSASAVNVNGSGNNAIASVGSGTTAITVNGSGANRVTTGAGTGTITLLGSGNNQVSTGTGVVTVHDRGIGGSIVTGGSGGGTLYYGTVGASGSGAAYSTKGSSRLSTAFGNFAVVSNGYSAYQLTDYGLKAGSNNLTFNGVKQVTLSAATAVANAFTLAAWTGNATLYGVGTNNTLNSAPKSGTAGLNYTLSNSSLQVSGGVTQTIALNSIQIANLVGAAIGANAFTISAWTGSGLLKGPAGSTNAVYATNDVANFFLSDALLQRTGRGDMALLGIQAASLTGGASTNTFAVNNWTGTANLDGLANGDTYNLTLTGAGTGVINVSDSGSSGIDTLNITASGTTQLTSSSVRVGTQRVNYGTSGIELLNLLGGVSGLTYNVQSTNSSISASTIQTAGNSNAINVSSTAGNVPATAGNLNGILGALSVAAGAGIQNRLRISDLGGTTNKNVTLTNDSVTGFAPAAIHYSVTTGNFTNANGAIDGIKLEGSNLASLIINVISTLLGSTTQVLGSSRNDAFNLGTSNSLSQIRGLLSIDGLTNDATPTTTLNASSIPGAISDNHAMPVGDTVNFNDQGDAGGYTYGLTASTLDRSGSAQVSYINLETVNLNAALAASTINVASTAANANTTVTGSVNTTPTADAFNITSTGANGNATFVAGTGDTAFKLQTTGTGSFTRIIGKGGNDTMLVSSNAIAGARGNVDSILGTLSIDAGAGNSNRLTFDDFTGSLPNNNVVVNSDAIVGLAPANIYYTATGGHFLNVTAASLDGISVQGANGHASAFNIQGTLAGSTTTVEGGSTNDSFNIGTAGNSLSQIVGQLTVSGLANDATPTITLSASSAPASLSASHALPVGDIVNFNDRGDAGGYTYGLTGATLDRGVLPTIHYISLETVNLNTALAASTINVMNTTVNANTTVTGSVNATPTTDAFNITSTGANGNATFVAGTGDTAFNLQTTGTGSFTRILGKGGNDTVLVSSNSIAGMRGNMDSILGTLAIDAGAGNNNRLAFDNFTGVPIAAAVIYNDAITGLAPANIFYAATGGHFLDLNAGTLDGIRVFGSNAGSDTFNVRSTLSGSTTLIDGEGANDTFNVSSDAGANLGTLAGILGHLTLQGGAGSANRLTISDSGNTDSAAARSNVIQTTIDIAGTQFQQLRNFAGTVAGGVGTVTINYTATGGGFNDGLLEDGVLLIGSNTLSSTFNVRTTLGSSTTKLLTGTAADYIVVSSTANTTGDPGTSIANGTLNGIAGNLTLDAGDSTSNRLIVSDSAQTLAPKNHVIQGETTIGGVTYEQVQNIAAGNIQYVASGGGFNHGALEDGVLLAGSSTLSSTFNVRTTLGGSTTKILGGTAADNVVISSTANTTGDPGFAAVANGTLDGIAGNLTLDAGGSTANRLIVSDSAQIATPKSNVLQTETSIGGSVYEKIQNFATGLIQYVASGGGFNHVAGPTDFADGIRLQGSLATSTAFTFRNTLGGSSLMAYGGSASDNFFVGSPPPNGSLPSNLADSGDLNLIRGQIAVVGNGGSDALVVNDAANGSTANKSNAFNYTVTPNRIVNDPTPVKTVPSVTIPPARTFAANGVIYNASGNAAQNSVTTLRVDGSGDANIFSVTPSRLTTYTIDGNLPASGVPIPGGGDYLKLDTTHFSDRIGGRKLHIDSVGNGFWSFDGSTATQPVNFLSFERFNHVDVTATVESLPNQSPVITVRDSETGEIKYQVQPYPGIAGGASVAVGDLNFDGLPDLAVSPGANLAANVTIFNGTPDANGNYGHAQLASFPAFASAFRTGVSLGIGDLNADGANELVVGAGSGSGGGYQPTVQVFDGQTILNGTPSAAPPQLPGAPFLAFEPSFTGGVNISIGDLNNDGREDILATRQTGTATVNVFSYPASAFTLARSFMAFTPAVNGGLTNAVGDYDGDGWNDILLGSGPGGSPGVMVYQGGASLFGGSTAAPGLLQMFAPSPSAFTGGVLVQATPVNGGDPGTIERAFITAKLQGTSTIATYAAPPGESLPASIQQVLPAGNPSPATLIGVPNYAVGADIGGSGTVSVYTPAGAKINTFNPFPGATGGVRTAVGDFNNDGTPDIAMGSGPGIVAHVKIYDGANGNLLFDVQPFEDFTGGVFVAAGDITGDGRADLIITPDLSGGPRVTVYRGGDFQRVANFFGIDDPNFRGGARAGVGDINGDGFSDLVVSAGFGGGPRLSIYDGKSLTSGLFNHLVPDFFLFETSLRNGVYVAVGDVNGDGYADIVGGAGPGGGPRVLVLSGKTLMNGGVEEAIRSPVANFFGGDSGNRGGIRVAVKNLDGDPYADLLTGSGQSGGSRVTGYLGMELAAGGLSDALNFDAFTGFSGGVFVG